MTCGIQNSLLALYGLRLEQRVNGLLRVFDDEPFFLRAALTFWSLHFRHTMVLSSRFLDGVMPQPGIGPGMPGMGTRLQIAPVCQFQHWGTNALDAEAGTPSKVLPAPASSGSSSTALNPSSYDSSCVVLKLILSCYPAIEDVPIFFFASNLRLTLVSKATQNFVNRIHWGSQRRHVVALFKKRVAHICGRQPAFGVSQSPPNRVGNSHTDDIVSSAQPGKRAEVAQNVVEVGKLVSHISNFSLKIRVPFEESLTLSIERSPYIVVLSVNRWHNSGGYICE